MIPRYASYRDPRGTIIAVEDRGVLRQFDKRGEEAFVAAHSNGVTNDLVSAGLITPYQLEDRDPLTLRSPMIPFVSYPDEWTPGMLREAGLLTLEIARRLWDEGFHLRDATAYNVVFNGPTPTFVDLGSIGVGQTNIWTAYGQFCDHFLSPLLIQAHLKVPFETLWSLEGVPLGVAAPMFGGLRKLRKGVLTNISLRSRLESDHADDSEEARKSSRRDLVLSPASIDRLMEKMEGILAGLDLEGESTWSDYETNNSYDDQQEELRDAALREFIALGDARDVAVDLGANTGRHSRILAENFRRVIAIDLDSMAVEKHRLRLREDPPAGTVFPIVANLANPTPARGFMNGERQDLLTRLGRSDVVTWMAVIHHLVIGNSIPLQDLADLAASLGDRHLIEFVDPDDPMARLLSASKGGEHHEYSRDAFQRSFGSRFDITELGNSLASRTLFAVVRR